MSTYMVQVKGEKKAEEVTVIRIFNSTANCKLDKQLLEKLGKLQSQKASFSQEEMEEESRQRRLE